MSENIRDFYDKEALSMTRYSSEKFWEKRYHTRRMLLLQKLLKRVFQECNVILDVGCGTGEYLDFSIRQSKEVYGMDISRQYLDRCGLNKGNTLIVADLSNLPFIDKAFDCVLCSEVIEHIKPNDNSIKEIFRVSRLSILISTPNHGLLRIIMGKLNSKKLETLDSRVGHINIIKFEQLTKKLHHAGWRITQRSIVSVFPPFLDEIHIPSFFGYPTYILEKITDKLLPSSGTISIVLLESETKAT
jgi:2-polyprenyl-3-methyl-5-hydroxy-6-metoxy-1,4-benzoquinol methylase